MANAGAKQGSITKEEASRFFLKKSTRWMTREQVKPVDQQESAPVREVFSQKVHGKGTAAVRSC